MKFAKVGKYEDLRQIGEGAFAVVFKARDPFIKRAVAIKVCVSDDPGLRKRFYREAQIAGNLHHRNIVTIFDFAVEGDRPYLVQEYLSGEDLKQKIQSREPVPEVVRVDWLLQIAEGLRYAHSKGVLHRDVKPSNVRVLPNGRVKILDFGIARLASAETRLTQQGSLLGTAGYLPPEQVLGGEVDARADVFAWGALAYELLSYEKPFEGDTISQLLQQVLKAEPAPLTQHWPACPKALAELITWCLVKEPTARCPGFDEVIAALTPILEQLREAARPAEERRGKGAGRKGKRRRSVTSTAPASPLGRSLEVTVPVAMEDELEGAPGAGGAEGDEAEGVAAGAAAGAAAGSAASPAGPGEATAAGRPLAAAGAALKDAGGELVAVARRAMAGLRGLVAGRRATEQPAAESPATEAEAPTPAATAGGGAGEPSPGDRGDADQELALAPPPPLPATGDAEGLADELWSGGESPPPLPSGSDQPPPLPSASDLPPPLPPRAAQQPSMPSGDEVAPHGSGQLGDITHSSDLVTTPGLSGDSTSPSLETADDEADSGDREAAVGARAEEDEERADGTAAGDEPPAADLVTVPGVSTEETAPSPAQRRQAEAGASESGAAPPEVQAAAASATAGESTADAGADREAAVSSSAGGGTGVDCRADAASEAAAVAPRAGRQPHATGRAPSSPSRGRSGRGATGAGDPESQGELGSRAEEVLWGDATLPSMAARAPLATAPPQSNDPGDETRPTGQAPGGAGAPRGRWLAAAAAVVVLAVAMLAIAWWTRRAPTAEAPPPAVTEPVAESPTATLAPTGLLLLEAVPWGEVVSITGADGQPVALPDPPQTPLYLELPPGHYRFELTHPDAEEPGVCEVEVVAFEARSCRVELATLDSTEYFKEAGWWR